MTDLEHETDAPMIGGPVEPGVVTSFAPDLLAVPHFTSTERVARGRAARVDLPRSVHAGWEPAPLRRSPVELLEEQAKSRLPELIPIRYGRMLESPFALTMLRSLRLVTSFGRPRRPSGPATSERDRTTFRAAPAVTSTGSAGSCPCQRLEPSNNSSIERQSSSAPW